MSLLLFFFCWFSSIYSVELSLAVTENDPSTLVEGVSVITGDLYSLEEDYVVGGAEPIRIRRSFLSRDGYFKNYEHLTAQFQCLPNIIVAIEPNGTPIHYYADPGNRIVPVIGDGFYGEKHRRPLRYNALTLENKGYSNTKSGEISAKTNLKNQYIVFDPSRNEKGKSFTLYAADGTQRYYVNLSGQEKIKGPRGDMYLDYGYRLASETLPNGHVIRYHWNQKNQMVQIDTTNATGQKKFASLTIPERRKNEIPTEVRLEGSDKRFIIYKSLSTESDVISPDLPDQRFSWDLKLRRVGGQDRKVPYLQRLSLPKNRAIQIGYSDVEDPVERQSRIDQKLGQIRNQIQEVKPKAKRKPSKYQHVLDGLKREEQRILKHGLENMGLWEGYMVKTLSSPVGKDETPITTHSFFYDKKNRNSYVLDVYQNKRAYYWNDDYRLTAVKYYVGKEVFHSQETFVWDSGSLRCRAFYDKKENPIFAKVYSYDPSGNVIEECFFGNLSGGGADLKIGGSWMPEGNGAESYVRKKTYSDDGRNLLTKEEDLTSGLIVTYGYRTDHQLLKSKFVGCADQVKIKHTYEYNDDYILIEEKIEDEISTLIKTIHPVKEGQYLGMPEVIEEKNGDGELLRKTILSYGNGARVEGKEVYDANGVKRYTLEMKYDDKGHLISQTNPIGQKAEYRYDENGNQIYSKDYSGRLETIFEYDFSNRLKKKEEIGDDGVHRVFLYGYDLKHNLISETDPFGNQTTYVPDAFGHRKEVRFPSLRSDSGELIEPVTLSFFDSAGNEIEKRDSAGHVTRSEYNAYGKPIRVTHPDGSVEQFRYYLDGNLKSAIDPRGISTDYEYDYLGRVIKKTVGDRIEAFYYEGQYLVKKTDPEGNDTVYGYDLFGRKIRESFGGEEILYGYDELGRLRTTQTGDLIQISEYDLLDRVIEERSESTGGELFKRVQYEYDAAGHRKAIIRSIDGNEVREEWKYDSTGRMIEKKNGFGFIETYEYENTSNRKIHTDPMGLKTIETYNSHNLLESVEKFNGKTLGYTRKYYHSNGKLALQIDSISSDDRGKREMRTRWEYNSRNLVQALIEGEGTVDAKITKYEYTPRGELERVIKPNGVVLEYRYDDWGALESLISSDGTVSHQMTYNRLGHLKTSDGLIRTTDPYGRITSETFPRGFSIENKYDDRGRRKRCSIRAADCVIRYEYDAAFLKRVIREKSDQTVLYSHTYTVRDLSGNPLEEEPILDRGTILFSIDRLNRRSGIRSPLFNQQVDEWDKVGNPLELITGGDKNVYTYDSLYQLTSESGLFNHIYAFDSLFNRIQKDLETYEINSLNQVVSHLEYDRNGNPIRHNGAILRYDALDRLIRIEFSDKIQTFTYDSEHRCLSKTIVQNGAWKTVYFLYDQRNEIGFFDDQGVLVELRVLGETPHAEIGAAIAIELCGQIHIPVHDLQGNLAALQSVQGEVSHYRYSAFGEEKITGQALSSWRFCSKRTDPITGFVNFGRRFYLPSLGRWLTPDPAGFTDGMNLYAYLLNDPLTHFDEYGLYKSSPPPFLETPFAFQTLPGSKILPSLNPSSKFAPHYYVNGIQNTLKDNVLGAHTLLKTYEGRANIIPAYSTSFGKHYDLQSVRLSKMDAKYSTDFIRQFSKDLKANILSMDALKDPRKIFITCFSRGSTDVYHACKDFTREQKNRLIITACGPIMILPRDLGFIVKNLVSAGDWCSLKCNPKLVDSLNNYRQFADVEILPQLDGFNGFNRDHFFLSKTYQLGIKEHAVSDYRMYGEFK